MSIMKTYSPSIPAAEVLDYFGSQTKVAKALELSTSTINEWDWSDDVNELNSYRLIHLYPRKFGKYLPRHDLSITDRLGEVA